MSDRSAALRSVESLISSAFASIAASSSSAHPQVSSASSSEIVGDVRDATTITISEYEYRERLSSQLYHRWHKDQLTEPFSVSPCPL